MCFPKKDSAMSFVYKVLAVDNGQGIRCNAALAIFSVVYSFLFFSTEIGRAEKEDG